jgi:hypothetical protein
MEVLIDEISASAGYGVALACGSSFPVIAIGRPARWRKALSDCSHSSVRSCENYRLSMSGRSWPVSACRLEPTHRLSLRDPERSHPLLDTGLWGDAKRTLALLVA